MIERTRTFSLTPSTPGRSEQAPRAMMSTGTPAWLARQRAPTISGSTMALSFNRMRPSPAARWRAISPSISSRMVERRLTGATTSRRKLRWRESPVRKLKRSVASAPSSSPQLSRPTST